MRRLALIVLLLVVLAVLAAVVNVLAPVPGGPLSDGGNGFGASSRADVPLTAGAFSLRNEGDRELVVEEIEFPELDGIDYLGAVVRRDGSAGPAFAVASGFPPTDPGVAVADVRQAEGFRVGPREDTQLLIGFRGRPGATACRRSRSSTA